VASLLRRRRPLPPPEATQPPALTEEAAILPPIVSRATWGARPPNHDAPYERGFAQTPLEDGWYIYPDDYRNVYRTLVVHHSAFHIATDETMRSIQDLHMDRNGWADVGYHYGIDRDGVIYEGRDVRVRGASVAGHNTGTMGVVVMGRFDEEEPLQAQLTALQTLVNALAKLYPLTHLAGHNEFNSNTTCPGEFLARYLDALAEGAGLTRGTEGYTPPSS
jgi:hypothetical protein